MKKVFIFLLTIALIVTPLTTNAQVILQQPLADPNDNFFVTTPSPNIILSGSTTVSWVMFDNDQAQIPFSVSVFDAATCQNTNFGQIGPANIGPSSSNPFSISWNTATFQTTAGLPDGNYCLRVCVAMKQGTADYSACNGRIIRLVNNNSLPTIVSTPSNLIINETQSWSYQIIANDVDNDPITYRLVQGPHFLSINQSTGLLSTNNNSRFLPEGIYRADYTIIVSADDGVSGSVSQQFVLSITKPIPQQPLPSTQPPTQPVQPAPDPAPAQPTPPAQTNSPTRISFSNIEDLLIITSDEVEIFFSASDADGIEKVEIFYVEVLKNEKRSIASFDEDNISAKAVWDLRNVVNGKYFIRVEVTDKAGIINQKESSIIEVQRDVDQGEISEPPVVEEVKIALIINAIPFNQAEIVDRRPVISGEFRPSPGALVNTETFDVRIDDESILSQCQVDASGFVCTPFEALPLGERTIFATYTDTGGAVAELEWRVVVKTLDQIIQENDDSINIFGISILPSALVALVLIICLTLLLLLIPWILFSRWRQGQTAEKIMIQESTPIVDEFDDFLKSANGQDVIYSEVPPVITAEVVRNEPVVDPKVEPTYTETFVAERPVNQQVKEIDPLDEYLNYIAPNEDLKKSIESDTKTVETKNPDEEIYVEPKPTD